MFILLIFYHSIILELMFSIFRIFLYVNYSLIAEKMDSGHIFTLFLLKSN